MEPNQETTGKPDFSVDGEDEQIKDDATDESLDENDDGDEETPTPAAKADEPADPEPAAVPFQRFQRTNEKLAAALKTIEALQAVKPAEVAAPNTPTVDIKELRKAHRAALYAGEDDKAEAIEDQIDAEQERRTAARLEKVRQEAEQAAYARVKNESVVDVLNTTAATLAAQYPFLDSNSPDADVEAIGDVVALRDKYMGNGDTPAAALQKAVEKVVKMYGAEPAAGTVNLQAERQQRALRKAGAASQAQPAPLASGVGNRSGASTLDGRTMTDDQVRELAKDRKALLAGGFGSA